MLEEFHKLVDEVARLRNQVNSSHMGTVHEVQKDMVRCVIGLDPNGQPVLGPWMHTEDHRGTHTQRQVYKVGQNVNIDAPAGDFTLAQVSPAALSNQTPPPATADKHIDGKGVPTAETYQNGKIFHTDSVIPASTSTSSSGTTVSSQLDLFGDLFGEPFEAAQSKPQFREMWISDTAPKQQQQSSQYGAGSTQTPPNNQAANPGKPTHKFRITESGAVTGWCDAGSARFHADKNGAKVKASGNFVIATKNNVIANAGGNPLYLGGSPIYFSVPPKLGAAPADPSTDEDMTTV